MVITAFLEKVIVSPRARGTVNLAKMMPAMQAWMMTPKMLWDDITITANGHCSVVALCHKRETDRLGSEKIYVGRQIKNSLETLQEKIEQNPHLCLGGSVSTKVWRFFL